jgi:hypothetical protein
VMFWKKSQDCFKDCHNFQDSLAKINGYKTFMITSTFDGLYWIKAIKSYSSHTMKYTNSSWFSSYVPCMGGTGTDIET